MWKTDPGSGMCELYGDGGKNISCGQHFGMEVFDSSVLTSLCCNPLCYYQVFQKLGRKVLCGTLKCKKEMS